MRSLRGQNWAEGRIDVHRRAGEYRVQVEGWLTLERVQGLYPEKAKSARMVWNYLREIGPRATARKILSRASERHRNEKFVACGFGRVIERPRGGHHAHGERVVFLLPAGPACAERIVAPEELLRTAEADALPEPTHGTLAYLPPTPTHGRYTWWEPVRGWHPESGTALPQLGMSMVMKDAARALREASWSQARPLEVSGSEAVTILPATRAPAPDDRQPSAVLFGYGNYAKTVALPGLRKHLRIDRIHELDPDQIPERASDVTWDTSPELPRERHDAVIIAGYHHTHAPIAAEALARGSAVLIEKPVATTRRQLHTLLSAMRRSDAPVFSGYQRRYLPFNDLARQDLGILSGDPVSYHAIVFEVPLPDLHWYRWPNSRSRLLSNGCHWLDHFLFLNDFAPVTDHHLAVAPDGQLNCSVTLANGAFGTMVLTDRGSRRLGVRDHVELRAGGTTVTIEDMSRYRAENESRVFRTKRIPRLEAYWRMYHEISRRIAHGEPGDSIESVQRSAGLVLDLEDQLTGPSSSQAGGTLRPLPAVLPATMPGVAASA